ncbi:30S ribosomal protein S19 [Candidatus Woesearchaeota archaeon]|nr:30S ribosomal protein S19 [Candidatus Woesearchaeota archaeon]MBT4114751.1 30S ribosomal protein S19 [Candidatus Woesearchaeota archaeon]MBT4248124.1 30S ribosomal protein S19 [Candidatus Woesearchaeota archaeon]
MVKEILFHGKKLEELQQMGYSELANILSARARRALNRGFTDQQKKLLVKIKESKNKTKPIKTHCRDMIIVPEMVGQLLQVYSGNSFVPFTPTVEMVGRYLGEFVVTRREVKHKAPGVGATRSTKHASMK